MSDHFLRYLDREHARLEAAITEQLRRASPDAATVARLKKAKLLLKDQRALWEKDTLERVAV